MKRKASSRATRRPATNRRGAGAGATRKTPTPGWKGGLRLSGWRNPRTPSVPATLDINLDEYFTATSLMGLIASQVEEPNRRWCRD
jgi:hypothetical protein